MRPSDFQSSAHNTHFRDPNLELMEWVVQIRYRNFKGKERTRNVGILHTEATEQGAITRALGHLISRGQMPPDVYEIVARKKKDIPEERARILRNRQRKDPLIVMAEKFANARGESL